MSDLSDQDYVASTVSGVWRCSCCGEVVEATDSRARWAGDHWQHACGDPHAGHHPCRFFRAADPRDAELARLRRELEANRGMVAQIRAIFEGELDARREKNERLENACMFAIDAIDRQGRLASDPILARVAADLRSALADPGPDGEGSDTD